MGQWSLMLRSDTLTSVNASGLFVYIWSISVADVGVILVGDSISWVRPSSVIVESQEECGFSKSILKSPILQRGECLSSVQNHRTTHNKLKGFYTKNIQKEMERLYSVLARAKYTLQSHFQGHDVCV